MFRIGTMGFGVFVMVLAGLGISNNLSDKQELAKLGDQQAEGKIIFLNDAAAGDSKYTFTYGFKTDDGSIFTGEKAVDAATFEWLKKGDAVTVLYSSGAADQSTAYTAKNTPKVISRNPNRALNVCFGTAAFGLMITVLGFFCGEEKPSEKELAPQKFSDNPKAALQRWRSEWELAPGPVC